MPAVRENIERVRGMEQAFLRGNAEGVASIYTDDAEWMVPGAPPIKGREAITQAWTAVIGPGGNTVRAWQSALTFGCSNGARCSARSCFEIRCCWSDERANGGRRSRRPAGADRYGNWCDAGASTCHS